jgi:hypothetical protein
MDEGTQLQLRANLPKPSTTATLHGQDVNVGGIGGRGIARANTGRRADRNHLATNSDATGAVQMGVGSQSGPITIVENGTPPPEVNPTVAWLANLFAKKTGEVYLNIKSNAHMYDAACTAKHTWKSMQDLFVAIGNSLTTGTITVDQVTLARDPSFDHSVPALMGRLANLANHGALTPTEHALPRAKNDVLDTSL